MKLPEKMTARTQGLYNQLINKAQGDRSGEWFPRDLGTNFFDTKLDPYGLEGVLETKTVLVRRAVAIDVMLKAMTDPKYSQTTHTAEICDGDLLLGILPMGSNGLGKVFPQFMTEQELRAGSITNRNTGSLFGHNTMNYTELLDNGLLVKIQECNDKINADLKKEKALEQKNGVLDTEEIVAQYTQRAQEVYDNKTNKDFYVSVKIACQAVIDYANRFADIAEAQAETASTPERKIELKKMAEIARKVPAKGADTFYEAIQSITFFHIAMHSAMNLMSLGRLDQVLKPYIEALTEKEYPFALEIMECFLIKMAGRLNLSPDYLCQQDHVDYATVLGTHPYYIDQKAGVNNFLQNIIIGGKNSDNKTAVNEATYLILQACTNVNLSTPGIYVRMDKHSPDRLYQAVAKALAVTGNNPAIINDDVMIPAMRSALMQDDMDNSTANLDKITELAHDFCVDGCWEPILNCCSDWTFSMLNLMVPMETSINRGASLSPDPEMFRGAKIAPYVPLPTSFNELVETFDKQLGFFVDQCALSAFLYYMIDEYAAPSPLLSAYLKGCMARGRDKAWAGADYNLAGVIFGGFPNMINTMLALKKWVFSENPKYDLMTVAGAFRDNFKCDAHQELQDMYDDMKEKFNNQTPKFGSDDPEVTQLSRTMIDICYNAVMRSAKFAKKVYQDRPQKGEWKNIIALRRLTGYYGKAMSKKFDNFKMKFTVGLGTFEQYNWQGRGIAADADRRSGDPLAPNFTPMPGTIQCSAQEVLKSFRDLGLDRFAGGVITDLCLDNSGGAIEDVHIERLLRCAIENNAGMLTLTVGSKDMYQEIYAKVIQASNMTDKQAARKLLEPYAGINVRIGGWQTPFITLPLSHMESYINRPAASL